jgi:hypothetical protein
LHVRHAILTLRVGVPVADDVAEARVALAEAQ